MTVESLKLFCREHFDFVHMSEDDFIRVTALGPPQLRPGIKSLQMLVRYSKTEQAWCDVWLPSPNRKPHQDDYHPLALEVSALGGKDSKK
jgi:hypothetical protein